MTPNRPLSTVGPKQDQSLPELIQTPVEWLKLDLQLLYGEIALAQLELASDPALIASSAPLANVPVLR